MKAISLPTDERSYPSNVVQEWGATVAEVLDDMGWPPFVKAADFGQAEYRDRFEGKSPAAIVHHVLPSLGYRKWSKRSYQFVGVGK